MHHAQTLDQPARRVAAAIAATAIIAAVAACSADDGALPANPTDGIVRLIVHDSFDVSEDVLAQFTAETGLTAQIIPSGDAGSLVSQLILTKDNPLGDAVFGIDNTFASRATSEGILEPYDSPVGGPEQEQYAPDATGTLTAIDFSDVCVNIDNAWFASSGIAPPKTLEDLARPEYKDLLVVENPATSSPGLAFLAATVANFGDAWQDYWASLKANGVKATDGWTDAYYVDFSGPSSEGERPLVVSYASSPPSEIPEGATEPETSALLDTCFRQVEYAGVLAGAANPEGAGKLIDFLLGQAFQEDVPGKMWVYPVRADAAVPADWQAFAPLAPEPFTLDPAVIAVSRESWIREWTNRVIG